jgi:hypothetical protein
MLAFGGCNRDPLAPLVFGNSSWAARLPWSHHHLHTSQGVKSGLPLAIAMAFHNIPEGMAVAGPLFAATKSKKKAFSRVDHLAAFTLSASQSTHDTAQKSHKLAAFVIASFLPCRRCSPQPYLVYSRS